ncbi:peroxisomal membrane anchor protein conserved region-domain-containing protein [Halteromyces radiatus]|uniref:peroxisomal membrane anchor protein conserved region-domain-containing protein n=1 Tax=Halteromyces radiatus TaxID=101107 RepID=UPI00221EB468|nr:peroxisomal membrane anchor protein conserved region-domain-containing protein [Halteromyces radiatus]KAI8093023.1 peroxisomal membrane anchor protein conserved region-domain-containing protein [Halteromyces radiatus]
MAEDNNQSSDTQERQKQDIKRLLSGQTSNNHQDKEIPTATSSPAVTPLREDKLKLAVSFLSSPNVRSAEKSKKIAFLKQKGLTMPEIDEAFKRADMTPQQPQPQEQQQSTQTSVPSPIPVSRTQASSLPPVVPTRPPMPRPTHIVYYSTPEPERLTGKRMTALALIFGVGAVGLTAGLVSVVKAFISPIFNSIIEYQRNRYNDRYEKLGRLNDTLRQQLGELPIPTILDDKDNVEIQKSGYWTPLINEQKTLMDSLERLVTLSQQRTNDKDTYSSFKTTLLDLKTILQRPEYSFSSYTPFSMYGSAYANRSNTGFDDAAVQSVKSEIRSFKGMLLSRRNFPTAQIRPSSTTTVATSTPSSATPIVDDGMTPTENTTSTSSTASHQSYHPRQRQSYRSELRAQTLAATTTTEKTDTPPNTDKQGIKGNTTAIEDITDKNDAQ